MTLLSDDEASVALIDAPFTPWQFARFRNQPPRVSRDWEAGRSYEIEVPWIAPNPEMRALVEADQSARKAEIQSAKTESSSQTRAEDAERRQRTLTLLRNGDLRSGEDLRNAALVFQHGDTPNDFLLAHTLALAALAKKDVGAAWLAAATLDRYLHTTGNAQIYGTQFGGSREPNQQPFNQSLVPDSLRGVLRVPPLADQVKTFEDAMNAGAGPSANAPPAKEPSSGTLDYPATLGASTVPHHCAHHR
jgi:hypothetical protein